MMIEMMRYLLIYAEAEPGHPSNPENEDEDERHEVVRIRQVFANSSSVFAFLLSQAPSQLVHSAEDVKICISYGEKTRSQHQNS